MKLKILVIQNSVLIGNKKSTFQNVEKMLDKYEGQSFDLIIFPEAWSVGWCCKNFVKESEELEKSETVDFLKNVALTFGSTVVGGTFIEKQGDEYKNTCPIITKNGKLLTTYEKMHLFSHKGSEENKYISTGNELKIINLNGIKIGITVCYDIRFPEIYRKYSKEGVSVFINVAAWSNKKLEHWNIMHRARAIENQCFMIVADQTGKICENEYNLGHSMIINPWGDIVEWLEGEEGSLTAIIDTEEASKLRNEFPLISDRRDLDFEYFKCKEINIYE